MPKKKKTKKKTSTKYIFVVGGVLSGGGKGITTASIGRSSLITVERSGIVIEMWDRAN